MATANDVVLCVNRIVLKRSQRGASKDSLHSWLEHMKHVWKRNQSVLKGIDRQIETLDTDFNAYTQGVK